MKEFGKLLRQLREEINLSQRSFAEMTGVSFRQIQRIEIGECDPSLGTAQILLKAFKAELVETYQEPNWNLLSKIGLPLTTQRSTKIKQKLTWATISHEISYAAKYLYEHKNNAGGERYFDSLKALLLALKTHYPSKFKNLKSELQSSWLRYLDLESIRGRDIKLRNICLGILPKHLNRIN